MTTPRLEVRHPRLDRPVAVAPGEVRVLDGPDGPHAPDVVATVLGTDRAGATLLDGRPMRGGIARRVRRGLAVVSGAPVAPDVSVHDHLAAVLGRRGADDVLAAAPLLAGRGADPAGVLSGGERRVLAWLRARACRPRAVVLDHAAEGLDADTLGWAGRVVAGWVADDVAVLVRAGRAEEHRWVDAAHRPASPRD